MTRSGEDDKNAPPVERTVPLPEESTDPVDGGKGGQDRTVPMLSEARRTARALRTAPTHPEKTGASAPSPSSSGEQGKNPTVAERGRSKQRIKTEPGSGVPTLAVGEVVAGRFRI